jgi:uroporphyrinogen-III synthase
MSRLSGQVVATTRDGSPEDPLTRKLEAEGARVVLWPTLSFGRPEDGAPLRRARQALASGGYDWVVVTSARAVDPLGPPPATERTRVAAVGAATAAELERRGWPVDVVGDRDAGGLVEILRRRAPMKDRRVLFPAASLAGETLEEGLRAMGARVDRVEAYRTISTPPDGLRVRADLKRGVGAVAFASPSAVETLVAALSPDWPGPFDQLGVAAIGPATAAALEKSGVSREQIAVADPPSLDGRVDACVASIRQTNPGAR